MKVSAATNKNHQGAAKEASVLYKSGQMECSIDSGNSRLRRGKEKLRMGEKFALRKHPLPAEFKGGISLEGIPLHYREPSQTKDVQLSTAKNKEPGSEFRENYTT